MHAALLATLLAWVPLPARYDKPPLLSQVEGLFYHEGLFYWFHRDGRTIWYAPTGLGAWPVLMPVGVEPPEPGVERIPPPRDRR
jgi:hypothetical protein